MRTFSLARCCAVLAVIALLVHPADLAAKSQKKKSQPEVKAESHNFFDFQDASYRTSPDKRVGAKILIDSTKVGPTLVSMQHLTFLPTAHIKSHRHVYVTEVVYVLKGNLVLRIGNQIKVMGPDTTAYIPPQTFHEYRNDSSDVCQFLQFFSPSGPEEEYRNWETPDRIVAQPADFYPDQGQELVQYLAQDKRTVWLKWAALFHDLGKPAALRLAGERITFYNHERIGAELFAALARRLRWSREKFERIGSLVALHMWPFHLSNVRRKRGAVTARACLKMYKAAEGELAGLFLLAMADSLAGQGPDKPAGMENELAALFTQVLGVCKTQVAPVLAGPRLVTGKDLIAMGLAPGPLFKDILAEVEKAQVEGVVQDRAQALDMVRRFLAGR